MSWRQFYFQWLKRGVTGPLPKVRLFAFLLAIVGGAVAYFIPQWESPVRVVVWAASAVVLVSAVMVGFLLAPYRMYKELWARNNAMEERTNPKLEITEATETNIGQVGRGWALRVRNIGTESAKGCHGRLEDIELETISDTMSMQRWPKDRDFHWSGQVEGAYGYEIPGGQSATLNIVYCDSAGTITLAYSGIQQFRADHKIPYSSPVLVLVNITTEANALLTDTGFLPPGTPFP